MVWVSIYASHGSKIQINSIWLSFQCFRLLIMIRNDLSFNLRQSHCTHHEPPLGNYMVSKAKPKLLSCSFQCTFSLRAPTFLYFCSKFDRLRFDFSLNEILLIAFPRDEFVFVYSFTFWCYQTCIRILTCIFGFYKQYFD